MHAVPFVASVSTNSRFYYHHASQHRITTHDTTRHGTSTAQRHGAQQDKAVASGESMQSKTTPPSTSHGGPPPLSLSLSPRIGRERGVDEGIRPLAILDCSRCITAIHCTCTNPVLTPANYCVLLQVAMQVECDWTRRPAAFPTGRDCTRCLAQLSIHKLAQQHGASRQKQYRRYYHTLLRPYCFHPGQQTARRTTRVAVSPAHLSC